MLHAGDQVSIADIDNDDLLTWSPPDDEYGYNFTSFDFTIVVNAANDWAGEKYNRQPKYLPSPRGREVGERAE